MKEISYPSTKLNANEKIVSKLHGGLQQECLDSQQTSITIKVELSYNIDCKLIEKSETRRQLLFQHATLVIEAVDYIT